MIQTISREQLQNEMSSPHRPVLIEVLDEDQYRDFHLPGAINVPIGNGFERKVQEAVPTTDSRIVVYCYDDDCNASEKAARKLTQYGYSNVVDYAGGKMDWKRAGMPVA